MRKTLLAAITLIALTAGALPAAACGSGGGGEKPTPVPTEVPFNPLLLTAAVLRPSDLPGYQFSTSEPPEGASFASIFVGNGVRVQSTVVHWATPAEAEADFTRNRRVIPALSAGAKEENYAIPGAESAFLYRVAGPPGLAAWALRGHYMVFIQTAPIDYANPSPFALDEAEFARLSGLVLGRVARLVESPELVTPVTGADIPGLTPVTVPTPVPTP